MDFNRALEYIQNEIKSSKDMGHKSCYIGVLIFKDEQDMQKVIQILSSQLFKVSIDKFNKVIEIRW